MNTHRTTRLRVHATPAKYAKLFQMASACRFLWNWATRTARAEHQGWSHNDAQSWLYWEGHPRPSLSFFTWGKRFTRLRRQTPWLNDLPHKPLKMTLRHWARSWSSYFNKQYPQRGKPTFHGRDHKLWIDFPVDSVKLSGRWFRLVGVGWVRLSGSDRHANGGVVAVRLGTEDGRKWFASIAREVDPPEVADNGLAIGLDMNAGQVATSTGDILRAPNVARLEARRKRYQRRMNRCAKGSNRRRRMRSRAAKAGRAAANAGRNWRHQVSRRVADTAGLVAVEDLNVRGMTRSAKGNVGSPGKNVRAKAGLNRVVLATGWGELRRFLEYKAAHVVAVDPRNTSRMCQKCGHTAKANRPAQARFECLGCGFTGNADVNAALNILARGKGASGRGGALALATPLSRQPHRLGLAA